LLGFVLRLPVFVVDFLAVGFRREVPFFFTVTLFDAAFLAVDFFAAAAFRAGFFFAQVFTTGLLCVIIYLAHYGANAKRPLVCRKPRRRDKHRGSPLRSDIPTTVIV
jgi:hypothetical protein